MATYWNDIKVNIPGVGERAYVFANYRMHFGQCLPNMLNTARACMYIQSTGPNGAWSPGGTFENIFPTVGEWLVWKQNIPNGVPPHISCYKVLELVDEATFNSGTCVSCYNNGHAGDCSDVYISAPPLPGDPNGCRYNNSIIAGGVQPTSTNWASNATIGYYDDAWIANDCQDCTAGTPPAFEPNMLVNCCDPTETYQLASTLLEHITGTGITLGVNQLGINTFTQAFSADLYIGGAQTGIKCWHLKEDYPPFGPTAYQGTPGSPTVFDNCTLLDAQLITNGSDPCCGPPPTEWCCMTGVAGPTGPSTCSQVTAGSCVVGNANVFAGPFLTQTDCINHPCGSPCPPTDPNSPFNHPNPSYVAEFCAGCLIPGSFYWGHSDCQCCDPIPPDECEPPFAKLAKLTSKLDNFTKWKKKSLGKK